jgi:GTPase SAR1 family protein
VSRLLEEPLRVAVVGGAKSGKSTLLNALLRQRVASTNPAETTRHVTWYRLGFPESVSGITREGTNVPLTFDETGVVVQSGTQTAMSLDHVSVTLQADQLERMTLVDTPGLQTADETLSQETWRVLARTPESSGDELNRADVLIVIVSPNFVEQSRRAIRTFQDAHRGLLADPRNVIVVVNANGQISDKGGAEFANWLAGELEGMVASVVPVNALLAQSSETGQLTDRDCAALRKLAALSATSFDALTSWPGEFLYGDSDLPQSDRQRLVEILGIIGVRCAVALLRNEDVSTDQVAERLSRESDLDKVRNALEGLNKERIDASRAAEAMTSLTQLAFRWRHSLGERLAVRTAVDALSLLPAMHRIHELRALREIADDALELPLDLRPDVEHIATSRSDAASAADSLIGSPDDVLAARLRSAAWQTFRNSGREDPRLDYAYRVFKRSFDQIVTAAQPPGAGL